MFVVFRHFSSLIWLFELSVWLLVTSTFQYSEQNLVPKQRSSSFQIWSNPLLTKAPAILDTSSSTMELFQMSDPKSKLINTKFRSVNKLNKILNAIRFNCTSRSIGYYADLDFDCRIFHYCGGGGGGYNNSSRFTFICPGSSRFSQKELTCAHDLNQKYDNCKDSERYFIINKFIYDRIGYENEIISNRNVSNYDFTTQVSITTTTANTKANIEANTVPPVSTINNTTMFTVQNRTNSAYHRHSKPYNLHRKHYNKLQATIDSGQAPTVNLIADSRLAEKSWRMLAPQSSTEITLFKNQIEKPDLFPLLKHENRYSSSTIDTITGQSLNIYSIKQQEITTSTVKPKIRKSLIRRPKPRIKKKKDTIVRSNQNEYWPTQTQSPKVYRKPLMIEIDSDGRNQLKSNQALEDYHLQQPESYQNNDMVLVYYPLLYGNSNPYGRELNQHQSTPYSSNVYSSNEYPLRSIPKPRSKMDLARNFPRTFNKFRKELREFFKKRFFTRI